MSSHAGSQRFSSRLAMLLSMLGIAVGTGNIWRFPRITAQNGGDDGAGAFLVSWIVFLLIWSLPLIIAEYALGRKGRMGVIGTFIKVAGERFAWAGAFVGLVSTAIMFYYSVVCGWCLYYFFQVTFNPLPTTTAAATGIWDTFQGGALPILLHASTIGLAGLAVVRGVRSIERVAMVLIPALLTVVIICLLRAITLPGSGAGIRFLFTPDWPTLAHPRVWLEALTQNAWDTGAGWGLILTYGAYIQKKHGIVRNALITGLGNNTVSITAAVMIFGTVFAVLGSEMPKAEVLGVMQNSGPASTGLTFIWLPQLFERMPLGRGLASLFFLGLSFAAFTSLISMVELAVRVGVDFGMARRRAIGLIIPAGFLLGIPSALNLDFLSNQDFVWGIGLMISGALIAFIIIRYGADSFRADAVDIAPDDVRAGRTWVLLIKYAVPVQALALLAWWMYQSAAIYAPETWYDPFDPYSVMTCVVQWGAAVVLLIAVNRWMVKKTSPQLSQRY